MTHGEGGREQQSVIAGSQVTGQWMKKRRKRTRWRTYIVGARIGSDVITGDVMPEIKLVTHDTIT